MSYSKSQRQYGLLVVDIIWETAMTCFVETICRLDTYGDFGFVFLFEDAIAVRDLNDDK